MIVLLIGKNKIYKICLPENVEGSYWLGNGSEKLINVKAQDGKWKALNNDNIEFDNMNEMLVLFEYCKYLVHVKKTDEFFILCCFPACENKWDKLLANKTVITIGNGKNNDIVFKSNLVSKMHARMLYYNGKWEIENFDSKIGTFINERPVLKNSITLKNGDIIFIMGLKIVVMGKYIFVNNPQNKVSFKDSVFSIIKYDKEIKYMEEHNGNRKTGLDKKVFSRVPRLNNRIKKEIVNISLPPESQKVEQIPLVLTLGSSLSMGVIMIVSVINTIDGTISGTSTIKQTIFSLITALAMMVSMLVFPILIQKYNKRRSEKNEKIRKIKYKQYLIKKQKQLEEIMKKQRNILFENYVSEEECVKIVLEKTPRLWERKVNDHDFLDVRVGIGDVPLDVEINLPDREFTINEDELVDACYEMVDNLKNIKSVPVVVSLKQNNILAIINDTKQKVNRVLHSIIIQLITFQNYEDLKLVFLMENETSWELVKMLPHVWDNGKLMRFFTSDYEDMKKISQYLVEELNKRLNKEQKDYKSFSPYYLIITDNYQMIENLEIIKKILKMEMNVGFSLLCLTDNLLKLPNECDIFINLKDDKTGIIYERQDDVINERQIIFNDSVIIFFDKVARVMSNIPIKYNKVNGNFLPDNYTFLDMYDVSTIEGLNIYDRWKKNDTTLSLKAPIGVDESGEKIVLDIHEKFHGPHGLIAGSTGSGKSEFIITYILSLAINYHPDDVTFVIIDYKGGGLAGAFQKREMKLPHLVGIITNIDTNGLQRSLMSIQSELRKRQIIFNKARDMTDEGTIDIYKYQKLYHDGLVKVPIPHLLIICDEFAELKQQQPDFMDELISVARIGRSLGVHLILATQKPSGIVNDQIRSNSKFSICLKVQDSADSLDVIKRSDAANLKKAGQFYMQIGNNEYFVLGQSGWSGAQYTPNIPKNIDDSIEFISDIGETIKRTNDFKKENECSSGEQLTNILRKLDSIAQKNNIKKENLWLNNINENIYINDLRKKYDIINNQNIINPIIGEYDDPYNQKQGIVRIDLSSKGNTIIYGNAESGKETLLSTMIYDLITTYDSNEVQIYILDFGTEALKIYNNVPHVGDVVTINEPDKIIKFFEIIQKEIKDRKKELIEYNGDYKLYLTESRKKMPMKVIVINSFETFAEMTQNKFDDIIISLTREGIKCGIVFVMSVSNANDVRYRLLQNFGQKIALQLNDGDGYINIFEKVKKIRPSHIFGRGLVDIGENQICEFQTAKICETKQYNLLIKSTIEKLKGKNITVASKIPVVPDVVEISDVIDCFKGLSSVPLGITKKEIKPYIYDFKRNFVTRIIANSTEETVKFSICLVQLLSKFSNINICVIDAENTPFDKKSAIKDRFNEFVINLKKSKENICIIIGIDKFINNYIDGNEDFEIKINEAEKSGVCSFIFTDSVSKFNNFEYEEWFKKYISKENGIWIGNGFDSQYALTATNDRREIINKCGRTYGYAVKRGKASLIKLIGMKENDEENE